MEEKVAEPVVERLGSSLRYSNGPDIHKFDLVRMNNDINLKTTATVSEIASFLSSIDKKIEITSTQLEKTREFKKGLLQQMFV